MAVHLRDELLRELGLLVRSGVASDPENVFGLYRTDGTRKPAATTITGAVAAFPAVV